ncbi:FISUMP domain-containing protein [Fibrobacter sp. UWB10]|uniref:FISUMP domain-containing protein n=1 Tax=Fibrobacter sp. UWB10 TaxID=1896201 RepID=UPI0024035976|nr:FISUMP domain-containing protein [Fibrobacter sp. UWB10]SMP44752.1 major paralogous domain-containing protein [Fibrobacter sp. UWB10]
MKKFLYMFALVFLLVACDDDDSFVSPNSDSPEEQSSSGKSTDGKSSGGKSSSEKSTANSSSSRSSSNRYAEDCKGQPDYVLCDARDGQLYRTFEYASQVWMAENLNYAMEGSFCYDDQDSNCVKYGRLYLWDVVNDACPEGWHLPYEYEYEELFEAVGGMGTAAMMLKSDTGWYISKDDKGYGGKGIYSFSVLPAGHRQKEGWRGYYEETFDAFLWMTAEFDDGKTRSVVFTYDRKEPYFRHTDKERSVEEANSIRCIRGALEKITPIEPSGETGTVTDSRDGQTYKTVKIGDQVWMAENLNYDYNEGSAISVCNDSIDADCKKFGRFYTWSAAVDSAGLFGPEGIGCGDSAWCELPRNFRGICPEGWHLPDSLDYDELIHSMGGTFMASKAMKSIEGWKECDDPQSVVSNGTDKYGFNALPAGYIYTDGRAVSVGVYSVFWTSSPSYKGPWAVGLWLTNCSKGYLTGFSTDRDALNVRCLKN